MESESQPKKSLDTQCLREALIRAIDCSLVYLVQTWLSPGQYVLHSSIWMSPASGLGAGFDDCVHL